MDATQKAASLLLPAILLCQLCGTGCDRNIEPFVEGEKPRQPDLARIFPDSDPSAQRPGAPGAAPPALQSVAATPPGVGIRGTIDLSPDLGGQHPPGGLLFVIARPRGVAGGPPLAVLRIAAPSFPVDFEIGPGDVMIPSMRFEGEIELSARLDSDGNAMTRLAGDLTGAASSAHSPGASGVDIILDTRI